MNLDHQRDNDDLLFTPKTPHFFKIILDDTIQDGKLGIPKGFVRKYGNGLPNPILLKVPSGAVWQVELTMCDGNVWLQNGWQEFAEYYSLVHGHFLVFRYEENSHFSVVIFDRSASEIKYPYTVTHGEEYSDGDGEFQEPVIEETEDNISIEILDDVLPCPKRQKKSPLPCPRSHKLIRTNPTHTIERTSKLPTFVSDIRPKGTHSSGEELKDFKGNINSQCSGQELEGRFNSPSKRGGEGTTTGCRGLQSKIVRRMQPLTANEKAERLQRASAFKSDNPFFVVALQPSHVHPYYQLSVPTDFVKKYFIEKQGDIILYISDGRTWSAKYRRGACNIYPRAKLFVGWKKFVQDNHLEVGDVCVLEMMNSTKMSLKVVIFPRMEDANCHLSPRGSGGMPIRGQQSKAVGKRQSLIATERDRALKKAKAFKSKNPFFLVIMRPSHITGRTLSVPISFGSRYFAEKHKIVVLRANGKNWSVKGYSKAYNSGMISGLNCGWSAFVQDNNLKVGNVCVFELVKSTEFILEVVIF